MSAAAPSLAKPRDPLYGQCADILALLPDFGGELPKHRIVQELRARQQYVVSADAALRVLKREGLVLETVKGWYRLP